MCSTEGHSDILFRCGGVAGLEPPLEVDSVTSVASWRGAGQGAEQGAGQGGLWEGSALLSHLLPATQYHAKVVTRNAFGFSQPSRVFNFATKGAGEDISKAMRLPMIMK